MATLLGCHGDAVTVCFVFRHVMSVPPDLHQQYLQTCQNLSQPENHFVARVLQEADKSDNM